jgi:hypothetical protein
MIRAIELGDRAGIVAAVACAIHCLLLPLIATSVQASNVFAPERTEFVVLAASLLISGATVVASRARRDARVAVWSTFAAGAGVLISARLGASGSIEQALVTAGAGLVVAAHVINLSSCRCRKDAPSCAIAESSRP